MTGGSINSQNGAEMVMMADHEHNFVFYINHYNDIYLIFYLEYNCDILPSGTPQYLSDSFVLRQSKHRLVEESSVPHRDDVVHPTCELVVIMRVYAHSVHRLGCCRCHSFV